MPRIKQTLIFKYEELADKAKERARNWYREAGPCDNDFAETITEEFHEVLSAFGFNVDRKRGLSWSGFWSQGDGAAFVGTWYASDFKPEALLADRPKVWPKESGGHACVTNTELHRIADELKACKEAGLTSASITRSHRGFFMSLADWSGEAPCGTGLEDWAVRFIEASRDLAQWFYKSLETEYEYQNSDEQIAESIIASGYEFTEEGDRA